MKVIREGTQRVQHRQRSRCIFDLGCVGDRKQTAIYAAQPQAVVKRFRMSGGVGLGYGLEGRPHQLIEEFWRQECPPLRQGPIGNVFVSELFDMLSQCASLGHHVKDQALDQFQLSDHGGGDGDAVRILEFSERGQGRKTELVEACDLMGIKPKNSSWNHGFRR